MSNEATHWAWKTHVRGVRQHVLLAIAEIANSKTRQCTPSLPELADRTGIGQSTIRAHIRALEDEGLIKVDVTNGGRRQRSTYTVLIDSIPRPAINTRQELAGIDRETPQQMNPTGRQELAGINPETRQERATNPPGAGGVVLRTKTGTREPGTTSAAAASASGQQVEMFETKAVEKRRDPNAGDAVAAWCDAYAASHDAKPTSRQIGQVGRESRQLLEAGNPPERVVLAAAEAGSRGMPTIERQYRDMACRRPVAATARPSTTDSKVARGLTLAAELDERDRREAG